MSTEGSSSTSLLSHRHFHGFRNESVLFLSHNTDYNLFLSHNTISLFEYQCQYCKYCTSSSLNNQPTLKFIQQNIYRITKKINIISGGGHYYHLITMALPSDYHGITIRLPCDYHGTTMRIPCHYHVITMSLSCYHHITSLESLE